MVLLVTYDLVENDENYHPVIEAIDRLGEAVEAQRSVWVVASRLDAEAAFEVVAAELTAQDRLFVAPLTRGSWWRRALCGSPALKEVLLASRE